MSRASRYSWTVAVSTIAAGCPKVRDQPISHAPPCDVSLVLVSSDAPPSSIPKWVFSITNMSYDEWHVSTSLSGWLRWQDGATLMSATLNEGSIYGMVYGPLPLDMKRMPNASFVAPARDTILIGLEWPFSPPLRFDAPQSFGGAAEAALARANRREWELIVGGDAIWAAADGEFETCEFEYRILATVSDGTTRTTRAERIR